MNIFKTPVIVTLLITLSVTVKAQQDPMYTHYMYNTLAVNPAYAGSRGALTLTGLARKQWVGFDGAPTSITGTAHTPIFGEKIGLGISFVNDKIGPIKNNQIYIDLAYHLKLNNKSKLAFGVKGGANMWSANLSQLKTGNNLQDASSYNYNISNNITPNLGAGVYYYRDRFYLGVSVPKMLQNKVGSTEQVDANGNKTGNSSLLKEQFHYFTIIGAVLNLNEGLQFKPTALVKATKAAPLQADLTAMFIIQEALHLGAMYRTNDALGGLIGFNINPQFYVGYSYDFSLANRTAKYNGGSHEVMLRYDLIYNNKGKIKSPRYF